MAPASGPLTSNQLFYSGRQERRKLNLATAQTAVKAPQQVDAPIPTSDPMHRQPNRPTAPIVSDELVLRPNVKIGKRNKAGGGRIAAAHDDPLTDAEIDFVNAIQSSRASQSTKAHVRTLLAQSPRRPHHDRDVAIFKAIARSRGIGHNQIRDSLRRYNLVVPLRPSFGQARIGKLILARSEPHYRFLQQQVDNAYRLKLSDYRHYTQVVSNGGGIPKPFWGTGVFPDGFQANNIPQYPVDRVRPQKAISEPSARAAPPVRQTHHYSVSEIVKVLRQLGAWRSHLGVLEEFAMFGGTRQQKLEIGDAENIIFNMNTLVGKLRRFPEYAPAESQVDVYHDDDIDDGFAEPFRGDGSGVHDPGPVTFVPSGRRPPSPTSCLLDSCFRTSGNVTWDIIAANIPIVDAEHAEFDMAGNGMMFYDDERLDAFVFSLQSITFLRNPLHRFQVALEDMYYGHERVMRDNILWDEMHAWRSIVYALLRGPDASDAISLTDDDEFQSDAGNSDCDTEWSLDQDQPNYYDLYDPSEQIDFGLLPQPFAGPSVEAATPLEFTPEYTPDAWSIHHTPVSPPDHSIVEHSSEPSLGDGSGNFDPGPPAPAGDAAAQTDVGRRNPIKKDKVARDVTARLAATLPRPSAIPPPRPRECPPTVTVRARSPRPVSPATTHADIEPVDDDVDIPDVPAFGAPFTRSWVSGHDHVDLIEDRDVDPVHLLYRDNPTLRHYRPGRPFYAMILACLFVALSSAGFYFHYSAIHASHVTHCSRDTEFDCGDSVPWVLTSAEAAMCPEHTTCSTPYITEEHSRTLYDSWLRDSMGHGQSPHCLTGARVYRAVHEENEACVSPLYMVLDFAASMLPYYGRPGLIPHEWAACDPWTSTIIEFQTPQVPYHRLPPRFKRSIIASEAYRETDFADCITRDPGVRILADWYHSCTSRLALGSLRSACHRLLFHIYIPTFMFETLSMFAIAAPCLALWWRFRICRRRFRRINIHRVYLVPRPLDDGSDGDVRLYCDTTAPLKAPAREADVYHTTTSFTPLTTLLCSLPFISRPWLYRQLSSTRHGIVEYRGLCASLTHTTLKMSEIDLSIANYARRTAQINKSEFNHYDTAFGAIFIIAYTAHVVTRHFSIARHLNGLRSDPFAASSRPTMSASTK